MKTVKEGKKPLAFIEVLNKQEALEDRVLMGLRLREGIDILNLQERFGIGPSINRLGILINDGFLNISDGSLQLSKKGILVSDELIFKILDSLAFE
jgi:coproporphyrinogen III oxidase-like Fe-S oxidoreductase